MRKLEVGRIGETRAMNCGLNATITAYRSNKSMDILFENGNTRHNVQYDKFLSGEIKCPLIIEKLSNYAKVTNVNITPHSEFLIDLDDLPILGTSYWFVSKTGYIVGGKMQDRLHRNIANAKKGDYVDHIDGNKLDNRKQNLRICTNAENCRNRGMQANNTSGYKGVSWSKVANKWTARIKADGSYKGLGYFDTDKKAAQAYNDAAIQYHGEFAKLNDI